MATGMRPTYQPVQRAGALGDADGGARLHTERLLHRRPLLPRQRRQRAGRQRDLEDALAGRLASGRLPLVLVLVLGALHGRCCCCCFFTSCRPGCAVSTVRVAAVRAGVRCRTHSAQQRVLCPYQPGGEWPRLGIEGDAVTAHEASGKEEEGGGERGMATEIYLRERQGRRDGGWEGGRKARRPDGSRVWLGSTCLLITYYSILSHVALT